MSTVHKITKIRTKTGKQGRPQLYSYPFASMQRGDQFRVREGHFDRVRMHRYRYYQTALGSWTRFTITRTSPQTFTVTRVR